MSVSADDIEQALRPYDWHGVEFTGQNATQRIGTCPFDDCGKERHFYANKQTGLWDCKKCGREGNVSQFLGLIHEQQRHAMTARDRRLLAGRIGVPAEALKPWNVGRHDEFFTFLVRDRDDLPTDIRCMPLKGKPLSTAGCSTGLLGAEQLAATDAEVPVFLTEGESDAVALRWKLATLGRGGVVLSIPGANTFKTAWARWLDGRTVHTLLDNDQAGREGEQRLYSLLHGHASELTFLHWPKGLHKGYDVRDWLSEKRSFKNLRKRFQPMPRLGAPKPKRAGVSTAVVPANDYDRQLSTCASVDDAVALMNERHFIVRVGGSTYVVGEERPGEPLRLLPYEEFRKRYMALGFEIRGRWRRLGDLYLEHRGRRFFDGELVFKPTGSEPPPRATDYNLWRGLAATPKRGDWSLLQAHIFENLCRRNQRDYDYLLNWMAFGVQYPGRRPGVAVCLHGEEGTGKGAFFSYFSSLFPRQHTIQVTNTRHLVGHFNALLSGRVLVFADEAFFAGDKTAIGVLNGLITEPTITVERKGIDPSDEDNCIHLIIASNHRWIVHASKYARRYFVLNVSDKRRQDTGYFDRITRQHKSGGREAMLHDLLARDLSAFNPLAVPRTEGLQEQIAWSREGHEAWWKERLTEASHDTWRLRVEKQTLHREYTEWMRRMQRSHPITLELLSKYFVGLYGLAILHRVRDDGKRRHVYSFPPLDECRRKFDPTEWPAPTITVRRRKVQA